MFQALPLRREQDTAVQFARPGLFSGEDAIFGDNGTVAHVRLPEMLYRIESYVFGAAFVWCLLFLLTTNASPSNNVVYGITILGLTALTASTTARATKRAFCKFKEKIAEQNIDFLQVSNKSAAAGVEPGKSSAVRVKAEHELHVDLIRYTGSMIIGPLVFFSLFNMLPMGEGDFLKGRGIAVVLYVIGVLAFTVSKLLVYDFQYKIDLTTHIANGVIVAAGLTSILIVIVDILTSASNSPIESNIWFFVLVATIGYGLIYVYVQFMRMMEASSAVRDVKVDTIKHILLVVIDILVLGFLIYGSLMDAYDRPFSGTRYFLTSPEIVLSPPPPSPPPVHP